VGGRNIGLLLEVVREGVQLVQEQPIDVLRRLKRRDRVEVVRRPA
jgi:hypothetical protein